MEPAIWFPVLFFKKKILVLIPVQLQKSDPVLLRTKTDDELLVNLWFTLGSSFFFLNLYLSKNAN